VTRFFSEILPLIVLGAATVVSMYIANRLLGQRLYLEKLLVLLLDELRRNADGDPAQQERMKRVLNNTIARAKDDL